jgi:hypothetical protein
MCAQRTFYTYLWLREDGTVYYVGKGSGNRAYLKHRRGGMKPPPDDRIIVQQFENEAEAFGAEIFLISFYGRKNTNSGCLVNFSNGGEGPTGCIWSEESRASTSQRFKNKTYEELYGAEKAKELREARSKQWKNVPKSEAQRNKMSAAALGKPKNYRIWCTGLTKDTDPTLAAIGRAVSKKLKGKTYEEIHGPEKARQRREHQRQTLMGRKRGPNRRKTVSPS